MVLRLACIGLTLLCLCMAFILRRKKSFFASLAWVAASIAFAVLSIKPEIFVDSNPVALKIRMRLALGFISFIVLLITLEAVRRVEMEVRYALLWVSSGLIFVLFAIYPDAVGWLALLTGMQYTSAITIVVFAFMLLVAFHYSLVLSRLRADLTRVSQYVASLEARVVELEKTSRRDDALSISETT